MVFCFSSLEFRRSVASEWERNLSFLEFSRKTESLFQPFVVKSCSWRMGVVSACRENEEASCWRNRTMNIARVSKTQLRANWRSTMAMWHYFPASTSFPVVYFMLSCFLLPCSCPSLTARDSSGTIRGRIKWIQDCVILAFALLMCAAKGRAPWRGY